VRTREKERRGLLAGRVHVSGLGLAGSPSHDSLEWPPLPGAHGVASTWEAQQGQ